MKNLVETFPDIPSDLHEWLWRSGYRTEQRILVNMLASPKEWKLFFSKYGIEYKALLDILKTKYPDTGKHKNEKHGTGLIIPE